jgi:hypothetical protein
MRYNTRPPRRNKSGGGPPAWFVFLVGVALVFGLYYLVQGVQNFFRTGGQGVVEATERAVVVASATAARGTRLDEVETRTPFPSRTPVPECQTFVVSVPNAIVRDAPSSSGGLLGSMVEGEEVCVLGREPETDWYVIDRTPGTRRLDIAYMHETVIRAVNPTPTPSRTPTALATVTPLPTGTPTRTPSPQPTVPTATLNPVQSATPTETPTPTDTPTITPSPTTFRQTA